MSGDARVAEADARRPYHHGDLARAALEIALADVARDGVDALSMRSVADRLGVAHRALYRHYPDRDALLQACAVIGYRTLAAAVADTPNQRAFADAYLRFACARPHLYALMTRAHRGPKTSELHAATTDVIGHARRAIGDDRAVQRVWAILHGGLSLHAAGAIRARDADGLIGFLLSLVEEP